MFYFHARGRGYVYKEIVNELQPKPINAGYTCANGRGYVGSK